MLMPNSLALLGAAFAGEARGRAIGSWAAAGAIAGALGPLIGGWLVGSVGWRSIFLINLPLAAGALWLGWRHVAESREEVRAPLDWLGVGTATLALAAITWGLTVLSGGAFTRFASVRYEQAVPGRVVRVVRPGEIVAGRFRGVRDALEAVVARVVPDRHSSSLGILSGRAAFIPAVPTTFDIPTDPDFVNRLLAEVSDGSVRLGTADPDGLELRYIAAPVAIDDERGVFVIAVDVRAELEEFVSAFSAYAVVAAGVLIIIGLLVGPGGVSIFT